MAFSVRPLEDMNEITSHMLDVVQAHMVLRNSHTVRNGLVASAELFIHSFYIVYSEKKNKIIFASPLSDWDWRGDQQSHDTHVEAEHRQHGRGLCRIKQRG